MPFYHDLLPEIKKITVDAGHLIHGFYDKDIRVMHKHDGSPVTEADQAADHLIKTFLEKLTPDIPVISEESYQPDNVPDISGGTFWLVDPLDGTKGFIKKTGDFTVNIGLIINNTPIMGVVYIPVTDKLYSGTEPGTAECNGQKIQVRPPSDKGLCIASSRFHDSSEQLDSWLNGQKVADLVVRNSSLKFCLVAAGEVDLYPRFAPTCEWDTAAGHAVLLAAGGKFETPEGKPFLYGKKNFLNGPFVASSGYFK